MHIPDKITVRTEKPIPNQVRVITDRVEGIHPPFAATYRRRHVSEERIPIKVFTFGPMTDFESEQLLHNFGVDNRPIREILAENYYHVSEKCLKVEPTEPCENG